MIEGSLTRLQHTEEHRVCHLFTRRQNKPRVCANGNRHQYRCGSPATTCDGGYRGNSQFDISYLDRAAGALRMVRTWSEVSAEGIRRANGYETETGSLVALVPKQEQTDNRECDAKQTLPRW